MIVCSAKLAAGGHSRDCGVFDIPVGGAKLRFQTPQAPDAELSLTIEPHGTLPVRVARQDGQYLGMAFVGDSDQTAQFVGDIIEKSETNKEQKHYPPS